jgi:hypothetical protein
MSKQRFVCSTVLVFAALASMSAKQSPTSPAPLKPDFMGEWQNTKTGMPLGGVPAIKVTNQSGELRIQARGACVPQNCEWPAVRFWTLPDIASKNADRGFAVFPDGKHLVLRMDGAELVVELYQTSDVKVSATRTRTQFVVMRYVRAKSG